MQTKEVLTAWSKNKNQVFMYQRFAQGSRAECVVVGFHTETGRTGYSKYDKKPDRMWVDIMNYAYNKETGSPERVLARYLTETSYESIKEYQEQKDRWALERLEIAKQEQELKTEFAEVCKSLGLKLTIENVRQYGFSSQMVQGNTDALGALLKTLKDAKLFYETIAEEVGA